MQPSPEAPLPTQSSEFVDQAQQTVDSTFVEQPDLQTIKTETDEVAEPATLVPHIGTGGGEAELAPTPPVVQPEQGANLVPSVDTTPAEVAGVEAARSTLDAIKTEETTPQVDPEVTTDTPPVLGTSTDTTQNFYPKDSL